MIKNVSEIIQTQLNKGLNTSRNFFNLQEGNSPACMDIDFNFDNSFSKRLGNSTMNTVALESTSGYGMFDFGVGASPQARRLLCSCGTGIYYSTDVGRTWAAIHTSRTAILNSYFFVKNYAINCNDNYNAPVYWAGSTTVNFANISTAAPQCKYPLSHLGYFFLLNETNNQRGVYYIDENVMFTSTFSNFQLPSEKNDEITAGIVLGKYLYISTKYKIFRLSFVGGNPDWEYKEIKSWGFVPRTVEKINIPGTGEVIIGLDWYKNIRVFDGVDDEVISSNIAEDNTITPFYLYNLNEEHLNKCWAENDKNAGLYRLYVVYGASSTITHSINFDYSSGSLYPYQNQNFQSGILAEDTASGLHLLVSDYVGRIHHIDSGNTDAGTGIDESFVSAFYYRQSPARLQKTQAINLFFSVSSSGTIYYEDRSQFSNVFSLRKTFTLGNAISSLLIQQTIDIPETLNVYQFKIMSSSSTAEPWRLNLIDLAQSDIGMGRP